MLQHNVRNSQQDFLFTDWYGFDIFYFKGKHVNDQVNISVEQVICQLGGIALHQLQVDIRKDVYKRQHQIIVVDNASTDDSLERLRKLESDANASQSCKVRVISADHNGGYGSGNNLGVRCGAEQGATHVLIANPDVVFSEQSLKAMLAVFARHPEVGIVTTRIRDARFPEDVYKRQQ